MELTLYDKAKTAIAEYKTVDEVKNFRDKALAISQYAREAKDYDLEHGAAVARVRAERKCGELLAEMDMAKGNQHVNSARSQRTTEQPKTLTDMGISKDQSSKWQQLAKVPDKEFEDALQPPEEGQRTKVSVKKILNPDLPGTPKEKMNPHALWWWGMLSGLQKHSRMECSVSQLLDDMTEAMRRDAEPLFNELKDYLNAK